MIRTIRFKAMFPNYETFMLKMIDTTLIIDDIKMSKEFFGILYRNFSDRWFRWYNEFQIIAKMEEYWNDNFPLYVKNKITWLTNQEDISSLQAESKVYSVNMTEENGHEFINDKYLNNRVYSTQNNINLVDLYKQQNKLQGYMKQAINNFKELFLFLL